MVETVQIGNVWYVKKNGVMGTPFAQNIDDRWFVFTPIVDHSTATKEEALAFIARQMDTWYTAAQAAERLVELGAYEKPPSTHDICLWARYGLFPGAVKITGKGGAGRGGSWRFPEKALAEFAAERRE